jgi:hypothetical protein
LVAVSCGLAPAAAEGRPIDWTEARKHWSFRPPAEQRTPAVKLKSWPRQRLDYFILARQEKAGILPSAETDARTFIRRVTLDLTGLPPTPEEVEAFLAELSRVSPGPPRELQAAAIQPSRPGASADPYDRLVDRLLASPRFGERMASMWLPLARFAEDQAHQVGNDTKYFYPNAHLYRDWVISAFNRDVPYNQFVKLQLAADQMDAAGKPELAALGFLGLGPKYYNRERLDVKADEWQDRVDTVTRTFLGLTVACARCHDHKYDPVTAHDYHALAGVFASTKMVNQSADGTEDKATEAGKMAKDTLHVVVEDKAQDLPVFIRGNVENKGPVVQRRFLQILSDGEPTPFKAGSGRKELADALTDPRNPLTARVMVNRIWSLVFGRPLVGTPSNFGLIGDQPTHPELLDDLAVRFEKGGWSVKTLVREMALSATYRQTSDTASPYAPNGRPVVKHAAPNLKTAKRTPLARMPGVSTTPSVAPSRSAVDPANALLWRMNRRRFTVEQWRDSVLYTSGQLASEGGPSQDLTDPANNRRTLYAKVSRLKLNDVLMQFDYPDANVHAEKRSVTTTPMQKLFVLNSPFAIAQAKALAARLSADAMESDTQRVERAYQLLYGRAPLPEEQSLGVAYLAGTESEGMTRWERYTQVLLAANEMLYVD